MSDDRKNPVLEAELTRAMAPYKGVLPDDVFAEFRDALEDALTTHPVGSLLLKRVRPPPQVDGSDEVFVNPDGTVKEFGSDRDRKKKDAG